MNKIKTIEIDIEIHKIIESARISFSETPNDILRRILKAEGSNTTSSEIASFIPASSDTKLGPNSNEGGIRLRHGLRLPDGTKLRMLHKGEYHFAEVRDEYIWVGGVKFRNPSPAAMAVTGHKADNGWISWEVELPDENNWIPIKSLIKMG